MAYYFKCPFFKAERYPSSYIDYKGKLETLVPKKGQMLVSCECAKLLCPNMDAKRFLFKNFCASDNWEDCTIAQMTLMKYERENNEKEN